MINVENEIFNIIAQAVRNAYPKAYVVGEYVKSPAKFPCVSIVEMDNATYERTQTSGSRENHVDLTYEINIYSNKISGKKSECKSIASLIDNEFATLGFSRTMLQPILNGEDTTIYRMVGRYRGVVSKDKKVFRR
jgi:hypothetical protein